MANDFRKGPIQIPVEIKKERKKVKGKIEKQEHILVEITDFVIQLSKLSYLIKPKLISID